MVCKTVGELRKALKEYPDDKPIIIDLDGSTYSPDIYNWADKPANDLTWPVAITISE